MLHLAATEEAAADDWTLALIDRWRKWHDRPTSNSPFERLEVAFALAAVVEELDLKVPRVVDQPQKGEPALLALAAPLE